jgi:hypothetical protein
VELRKAIFFAVRNVFIFSLAGTITAGAGCAVSVVCAKLATSKGETKVALPKGETKMETCVSCRKLLPMSAMEYVMFVKGANTYLCRACYLGEV